MNEHDHDEIARRLRESGTVPAPEKLRAEVMDQVRAEPRRRPARRPFLPRLLPYAAAAALVAAAVLAIGHLGGGSGSSSGGAGSIANGAGGGQAVQTPAPESGGGREPTSDSLGTGSGRRFAIAGRYLGALAQLTSNNPAAYPRKVVLVVPRPLYAAYLARFRFFERHSRGERSVSVILRPAPRR